MHFSLASFASAAVLLTGLTSALPASIPSPDLRIRDAGPTGTLLSPAGDAGFLVGDLIPFKYQRTISEEATTSSLNVTLITYDGRVTYHANTINLVQTLAPATEDAELIEATIRMPQLAAGYDNPEQTSWVAYLEVTETQTGTLGAAPFLAASPRITIDNA